MWNAIFDERIDREHSKQIINEHKNWRNERKNPRKLETKKNSHSKFLIHLELIRNPIFECVFLSFDKVEKSKLLRPFRDNVI